MSAETNITETCLKAKDVTLLEILDRVLDKGVVISGDIVISVADIDLVFLGLRVLLSSVETMERIRQGTNWENKPKTEIDK